MPERIYAEGLNDILRDLRAYDRNITKTFQVENKRFAEEVADATRIAYVHLHPVREGAGFDSIRGQGSQSRATVAIGGPKAPYLLGQEFGAHARARGAGGLYNYGWNYRAARRSSMRQFPAYRSSPTGRGSSGYFLFPTLRREIPQLQDRYLAAIEAALMGSAGPETWDRIPIGQTGAGRFTAAGNG